MSRIFNHLDTVSEETLCLAAQIQLKLCAKSDINDSKRILPDYRFPSSLNNRLHKGLHEITLEMRRRAI